MGTQIFVDRVLKWRAAFLLIGLSALVVWGGVLRYRSQRATEFTPSEAEQLAYSLVAPHKIFFIEARKRVFSPLHHLGLHWGVGRGLAVGQAREWVVSRVFATTLILYLFSCGLILLLARALGLAWPVRIVTLAVYCGHAVFVEGAGAALPFSTVWATSLCLYLTFFAFLESGHRGALIGWTVAALLSMLSDPWAIAPALLQLVTIVATWGGRPVRRRVVCLLITAAVAVYAASGMAKWAFLDALRIGLRLGAKNLSGIGWVTGGGVAASVGQLFWGVVALSVLLILLSFCSETLQKLSGGWRRAPMRYWLGVVVWGVLPSAFLIFWRGPDLLAQYTRSSSLVYCSLPVHFIILLCLVGRLWQGSLAGFGRGCGLALLACALLFAQRPANTISKRSMLTRHSIHGRKGKIPAQVADLWCGPMSYFDSPTTLYYVLVNYCLKNLAPFAKDFEVQLTQYENRYRSARPLMLVYLSYLPPVRLAEKADLFFASKASYGIGAYQTYSNKLVKVWVHRSLIERAAPDLLELVEYPVFGKGDQDLKRASVRFHPVLFDLKQPVEIRFLPQKNAAMVLERSGGLKVVDLAKGVISQVTVPVQSLFVENGLLGVAMHPKFAANGRFYLRYTASGADPLKLRIAEWEFPQADILKAPQERRVLLEWKRNSVYHVSAQLNFGPDGYLYIGVGDDCGPLHRPGPCPVRSMSGDSHVGSILRIDVDGAQGDRPYAIPNDNPGVRDPRILPEVWAWGFRNPWRFTFDRHHRLVVTDVGDWSSGEITFALKGRNHGWSLWDAHWCLDKSPDNCAKNDSVRPLIDFGVMDGRCPVGGVIYRGRAVPQLKGALLFSDFVNSRIWAMHLPPPGSEEGIVPEKIALGEFPISISSFAEGPNQEIYVTDFRGGQILQMEAGPSDASRVARK